MAMITFVDGNDLTALQLNTNFTNTVDISTVSPQTVTSAVTFGGLATTTLSASGASVFGSAESHKVTIVTAAGGYTVVAGDFVVYINKTSGAATAVTLPTAPSTNRWIIIKDKKGDAATNPITISGAQLIDGQSTLVINNNYGSACLQYDGSAWSIW